MRFGYRLQEIMFHFLHLSSTRIVQDFQLCSEFCVYFVHVFSPFLIERNYPL